MEELKVHIWHITLWEYNKTWECNKTTTETPKKICYIYGQGVITNTKSETGIQNFVLAVRHWD